MRRIIDAISCVITCGVSQVIFVPLSVTEYCRKLRVAAGG